MHGDLDTWARDNLRDAEHIGRDAFEPFFDAWRRQFGAKRGNRRTHPQDLIQAEWCDGIRARGRWARAHGDAPDALVLVFGLEGDRFDAYRGATSCEPLTVDVPWALVVADEALAWCFVGCDEPGPFFVLPMVTR